MTRELDEVCQQLLALLESDGNAQKLFKTHADLLASAFPGHFAAFEAAIAEFDSETALTVLQEAMRAPAKESPHA